LTKEPAEFRASHVSYHAHLLGREMYMELKRQGEDIPSDVGSEPVWHFDDQYRRSITDWNITLRTGDELQSTCVMDSTGRTKDTSFDRETTDEMCWASLNGWGNYTGRSVKIGCKGEAWTGQLADLEPGFGLATRHPMSSSSNVIDMSHLLTGGQTLRLSGAAGTCSDSLPEKNCGSLLAFAAKNNPAACDQDLQMVNARLAGMSAMDVCCASFCKEACATHSKCKPNYATMVKEATVQDWVPYTIKVPQCGFETMIVLNDPAVAVHDSGMARERASVPSTTIKQENQSISQTAVMPADVARRAVVAAETGPLALCLLLVIFLQTF